MTNFEGTEDPFQTISSDLNRTASAISVLSLGRISSVSAAGFRLWAIWARRSLCSTPSWPLPAFIQTPQIVWIDRCSSNGGERAGHPFLTHTAYSHASPSSNTVLKASWGRGAKQQQRVVLQRPKGRMEKNSGANERYITGRLLNAFPARGYISLYTYTSTAVR